MNYYHIFTPFIPFLGKDLFGGSPICGTSPPWDHVEHDGVQPTDFWATRESRYPHPTNKWWEAFVLGSGDGVVNAMPYYVQALDDGFHVDLPDKVANAMLL